MSGMSKEQIDQIKAEVADQPDNFDDLVEVVMELKKQLESLTERLTESGVI